MTSSHSNVSRLEQLIQRYLLPLIALAYLLSAIWPELGIWLRTHQLLGYGKSPLGEITSVHLLLAGLLFNTGLAVPLKELIWLGRHPKMVLLGLSIRLTACGLIMLLLLAGGSLLTGLFWDAVLLGLILVMVMPVANSSAGWSHHSDANVGLSISLILVSVILSPLLVPGLLQLAGKLAQENASISYSSLANNYAGSFVMLWVILPALTGIICRAAFLKERYDRFKAAIKAATCLCLLLLNYANGAVSLPQILHQGAGFVVGVAALCAILLCVLLFLAAWIVSRLCRLSRRDQLAVMYSTAMSNTGVALVLATSVLPHHTTTHVVIILYTLIQHIIAGIVDEIRIHSACSRECGGEEEISSTITNQPISKSSKSFPERPTTQTGSQAAVTREDSVASKGS